MRWILISVLALFVGAGSYCLFLDYQAKQPWQRWQAFTSGFVEVDGRVVDVTANNRSTSEGQSYGLFFALVANDREAFSRILAWTEENLALGDISLNLPSWLWGQNDAGNWQVLDSNSASDSDLWIAYSLLEASRLWSIPEYERLGIALLNLVASRELVYIENTGYMLLPAPKGFLLGEGHWRFNPSYLPPFLLQKLVKVQPNGPWANLLETSRNMIFAASAKGIAPDWFEYTLEEGAIGDSVRGSKGSYDAIRVYLWAGMISEDAEEKKIWLEHFRPMSNFIGPAGAPESIDVETLNPNGQRPIGFSVAMLPFLAALGEDARLKQQKKFVAEQSVDGILGEQAHYYDQVLALFGLGWTNKQFRFDAHGQVVPRWTKTCCALAAF